MGNMGEVGVIVPKHIEEQPRHPVIPVGGLWGAAECVCGGGGGVRGAAKQLLCRATACDLCCRSLWAAELWTQGL